MMDVVQRPALGKANDSDVPASNALQRLVEKIRALEMQQLASTSRSATQVDTVSVNAIMTTN